MDAAGTYRRSGAAGFVGGLKVPFRLRDRAMEWRVRDFRYDVEINPKTFRPTTPLETGG